MKIQEIIAGQKMFKKYADRYSNPYIYYQRVIPEKIINEFYIQASIEELALYYFGWVQRPAFEFPGFLCSLERQGKFSIPSVEGILTAEFWEKWICNNLVDIMQTSKTFLKG